MSPAGNFTLHAILAACLAALAASSAAAGKPVIDNEGHAYLTIHLMGGNGAGNGQQLEVVSYQWGAAPSALKLDRNYVKSWSTSGDASAERTHKPLRMRMEYDGGNVTLNGRFPTCRVGAAFPAATVGQGDERYEMRDVTVASCSPESMSLSFKKVTVRGWNPEKKED